MWNILWVWKESQAVKTFVNSEEKNLSLRVDHGEEVDDWGKEIINWIDDREYWQLWQKI